MPNPFDPAGHGSADEQAGAGFTRSDAIGTAVSPASEHAAEPGGTSPRAKGTSWWAYRIAVAVTLAVVLYVVGTVVFVSGRTTSAVELSPPVTTAPDTTQVEPESLSLTASVDTASVDTASVDTAPVDTAPVDTAPVDTAETTTTTTGPRTECDESFPATVTADRFVVDHWMVSTDRHVTQHRALQVKLSDSTVVGSLMEYHNDVLTTDLVSLSVTEAAAYLPNARHIVTRRGVGRLVGQNVINGVTACHYEAATVTNEPHTTKLAQYYVDLDGRVVRYEVANRSGSVSYTYDFSQFSAG